MCMFVCECMYLCMCRQWVRKWRQLSRFLMSHLINLRQSLTNLQLGRSLASTNDPSISSVSNARVIGEC